MSGDERAPRLTPDADRAMELLEAGEMQILGLLPRSSNYTFLVKVSGLVEMSGGTGRVDAADHGSAAGPTEALGVYKPRAGEAPLWDFPDGTLGLREVAAFRIAQALGWPRVPPTLYRDGPEGPGSLQLFLDFDPSEHYFTLLQGREEIFRRVALFDAVVNNADRKGGHCLLASDGDVFVIDHGVCFSSAPKLRTVIWDFAGDPISREESDALRRLGDQLGPGGALRTDLARLLQATEIDATGRRALALADAGRFPEPGFDRPYPWPAI
jgi:uncharacterized repeat protein (TIGR03843 family)